MQPIDIQDAIIQATSVATQNENLAKYFRYFVQQLNGTLVTHLQELEDLKVAYTVLQDDFGKIFVEKGNLEKEIVSKDFTINDLKDQIIALGGTPVINIPPNKFGDIIP